MNSALIQRLERLENSLKQALPITAIMQDGRQCPMPVTTAIQLLTADHADNVKAFRMNQQGRNGCLLELLNDLVNV